MKQCRCLLCWMQTHIQILYADLLICEVHNCKLPLLPVPLFLLSAMRRPSGGCRNLQDGAGWYGFKMGGGSIFKGSVLVVGIILKILEPFWSPRVLGSLPTLPMFKVKGRRIWHRLAPLIRPPPEPTHILSSSHPEIPPPHLWPINWLKINQLLWCKSYLRWWL